MARLFPGEIDAISASAPLEAATAIRLRDEPPDDWWVIHACHWTLPEGRKIGQGEVDFVVLSSGGTLCLIEQKNGIVTVDGEEYVKHYGLHRKSVSQQMGRSRHAVMTKQGQHSAPRGGLAVVRPDWWRVSVEAGGGWYCLTRRYPRHYSSHLGISDGSR